MREDVARARLRNAYVAIVVMGSGKPADRADEGGRTQHFIVGKRHFVVGKRYFVVARRRSATVRHSGQPRRSPRHPMPASLTSRRPVLVVAAIAGGVMAAMIVEIMLARRGLVLTGAWQGLMRGGGTPIHAALAWWAMTGAGFVASFVIALATSRFTWLYLRSLRWVAAAALVLALAAIGGAIPLAAADAASHHALATFMALGVAMLMAGFGAFFAVRQ